MLMHIKLDFCLLPSQFIILLFFLKFFIAYIFHVLELIAVPYWKFPLFSPLRSIKGCLWCTLGGFHSFILHIIRENCLCIPIKRVKLLTCPVKIMFVYVLLRKTFICLYTPMFMGQFMNFRSIYWSLMFIFPPCPRYMKRIEEE